MKTTLKFQQRFRSEAHNVFSEKVSKIALSADDDKRIQAPDGVASYAYDFEFQEEFLKDTKTKN